MALHAVTGAFGYSGQYMARRLLDRGHDILNLTNSPGRPHALGRELVSKPLQFDAVEELARSLRGVTVLYNTYWVRFNHRRFRQSDAVENTLRLFDAAHRARVQRIVHVSITNPSEDSPLEYFRGKARLERALRESGMSYAILRPAVLFGREDVLINNIAWALRRLPLFGVFGDGEYRLQPIHVDDFADLAVRLGDGREDVVVDAIGPETFTYRELVGLIGEAVHERRRIVSVPPALGHWCCWAIGKLMGDVILTRQEIEGLMSGLLHVESPPTGEIRLSDWVRENAGSLGVKYTSELARRRNRKRRVVAVGRPG